MPLLKTGKKYKLMFASVGWADIFLNSPRAPKGAKSVCIHKIRLTQHCRSKISQSNKPCFGLSNPKSLIRRD